MKKVIIANDHGGISIKEKIKKHLKKKQFDVLDLGTNEEKSVDYVDYAKKACDEFLNHQYEFGVLICGTGIGVSIAANKINGIRCALIHDHFTAKMAKKHNKANFIALGGRVQYSASITSIIDQYIGEIFEQAKRHQNRLKKLTLLEKEN